MEEPVKFFDAHVFVGRPKILHPWGIWETTDIRGELERVGIARAVAYHVAGREGAPVSGNDRLLEHLNSDDPERFFVPQWVALPSSTGEFPDPEQLVDTMVDRKVRSLRLFPGNVFHNFSLSEWCSGRLFGVCEERGVPVFIDLSTTDWEAIEKVLRYHKRLRLVVTSVGYRDNRYCYPLLDKYKNLAIDTGRLASHQGLEDLCERFGPERAVFTTSMPTLSPGGPVAMVTYANIPEEWKKKIARENLERLLTW